MTLPQLLLDLVAIYVAAKVGGEIAERYGQPSVLGELLGGVVIGVSGLRLLDPKAEVIHLLAELGVLILLFEVGLETKLHDLSQVGPQALAVALIGMAMPFLLGFGLALAFGLGTMPAVLIGASLTATSIGISARVMHDQGVLATASGSIILAAAIIDDVLGVSLLGVVSRVAELGTVGAGQVLVAVGSALGFVAAVLLVGQRLAALLLRVVGYLRGRGILLVSFTAFAFGLAYLATAVGSAALIGAFAAGLLLEETEQKHELETQLRPVSTLFAPIFFVSVGASLDLASLSPFDSASRAMLLFAALLTAAAVVGKLLAGLGAGRGPGVSRLAVGVGMLARGEVGLIFAGVGATSGLLAPGVYAAVVLTMALTTLAAPPWLKLVSPRMRGEEPVEEP